MNNIKLTVVVVLLFVFVFPMVLTFGIRYLPAGELPETGGSVKVYGGVPTTFLIKNQKEGLVGVNLYAKNPSRSIHNLKLSLFDQKDQLVREIEAGGIYIQNGELVKLGFASLPKGEYKATLSSEGTYETAIEVYMEKGSGNVAYALLYQPPSRFSLISAVYLSWFKHLFGAK